MIIMRIKGGLGNQMFQYALAYAMSRERNVPFVFDLAFTKSMTYRKYRLPKLNVNEDRVVDNNDLNIKIKILKNAYVNKVCRLLKWPKHNCGDIVYWLETPIALQYGLFEIGNDNLYLDGYFQSDLYFKKYRADLLVQFTAKYREEEAFIKNRNYIISINNTVAVHVRQTDFKKFNKKRNTFHYVLDKTYYIDAINYMRSRLISPTFFWFSDDIHWVEENIGINEDFFFISSESENADIDDLLLMKSCKHIITANSTFSWWAAWLNENEHCIRIVPKRQYGMDGMIPSGWIKI